MDTKDKKTKRATSELEEEFKVALKKTMKEINAKIEEAHTALDKACEISEKHGVPFYSSISPLGQQYRPTSFSEKFGEIENLIEEITNYDVFVGEHEGWQHSAVC